MLTNQFSQAAPDMMTSSQHVYEVRPRKDKRSVDLISDAPFGRLWDGEPNAIGNAVAPMKPDNSKTGHVEIR